MKIATINGLGSTDNGERILKLMDLSEVVSVSLHRDDDVTIYPGGSANMTFTLKNGDEFTVINSFGMGYGGTGPHGAVSVLLRLGVPKIEAEQIFTNFHQRDITFIIN